MGDFDLQQFLVSVVVPVAIVLTPKIADHLRATNRDRLERIEAARKERLSDHEIGHELRDELRRDIDRLKKEVEECEEDRRSIREELGSMRQQIVRLERSQRESGPSGWGMVA